jgi:hypothetical protein
MSEAGDIYMVFKPDDPTKLKAMGKMKSNDTIGASVNDIEVDTNDVGQKNMLKSKFAAKLDKEFNVTDSVIVKLEKGGSFLYIPGFVVEVVAAAAAAAAPTYNIGVAKDSTITAVKEENIAKNVPLTAGQEGWFFSDTVLGSLLDGTQTITYEKYAIKAEDIITKVNGARKIKVENTIKIGSDDAYEINPAIVLDAKDITQVKMKSVVPFIYNTPALPAVLSDPAVNHVVMTEKVNTIFGGKKSRKQKTRKNTMPLQFAPGAKRAYLKRRKSSRK